MSSFLQNNFGSNSTLKLVCVTILEESGRQKIRFQRQMSVDSRRCVSIVLFEQFWCFGCLQLVVRCVLGL